MGSMCWKVVAVIHKMVSRNKLLWIWLMLSAYGVPLYAETPLLERTITLTFNQERVDIALEKISQQGNFTFSYSPGILDVTKLVSFSFAGNTVREVLDEIFQGGIQYKIRGNYIILTKGVSSSSEKVYSGYVVDEAGQRLKNVSVYDPVSLSSAVTDDYGYFQISIDQPSAQDVNLAISKLNYGDTTIAVSHSRTELLKVRISAQQERIATLADSVGEKILRFWKTKLQTANIENIQDTLYRTIQVSLVPFIGTNHTLSGNVINEYSFNIFGGYALGVEKLEIGTFFNIDRGDVKGMQYAGFFNAVGGKTYGLQFAGFVNLDRDSVKGAQLAGLINLSLNGTENFSAAGLLNVTHRDSRGTHLAGLANVAIGNQKGVHLAGLFNFSTQATTPFQGAGLFNFAAGGMNGAQASGLVNFAGGELRGAQVSGLINFAPGKIYGAQVSGLINYATKIHGAQVGFLNITDSIRGVPIGFLSIVAKGYHQLEISADEIFYTNVAFRTGIRQFYNILTVGANPSTLKDEDQALWTFGYGIGTAPRLTRWLNLNFDVTANQIVKGGDLEGLNLLNKFYAGVEFRPLKKLGITVGATLNAYFTDATTNQNTDLFADSHPHIIYEKTYSDDKNVRMWLGGKVGLRFL